MLGLLPFTVASTVGSYSDKWEELWRRHQAELVLNGVTLEEHFHGRAITLCQLLEGLIDRFRKTELVSSAVLEVVAEIVDQIDTEFLGIEAWQQAETLPDRVRKLASIEATKKAQLCLSELRKRLRLMKMLLPQVEAHPRLAYQFPETSEKLSAAQEEVFRLFRELRGQISELIKKL
jgi:hypothetical protein